MRKNQQKTPRKTPFSLKKIKSSDFVLGVDEAGRGAWAGPVVAACVAWIGRNPVKSVLRDSKKMTAKEREKTYGEILQLAQTGKLACWIGIIENTVIDTAGIREANRRAMEQAIFVIQKTKYKRQNGGFFPVIPGEWVQACGTSEDPESRRNATRSEPYKNKGNYNGLDLLAVQNCTSPLRGNDWGVRILIDGRDNYSFSISDLPIPEYIIRGDSKVKQIMAASILAKVTRDRIMIEFEKTFPWYGFEKHKGYGTEIHQKALKKLGVSEIHRKSYEPIKLSI